MGLETYHYAWLAAHPERTEEWLVGIIGQGFHIHHMDGNHDNDEPRNLILIESGDHMLIHNGVARLIWKPPTKGVKKTPRVKKVKVEETVAQAEARLEAAKIREYIAIDRLRKAGRRAENARLKAEKADILVNNSEAEQSTSPLAGVCQNGLVNYG